MQNMQQALDKFDDSIGDIMDRTPDNYPEYKDALHYNAPQLKPSDWHDVPIIAAETFLHLQHHHKTLVDYLCRLNETETTFQLRHDLELRMDVSNRLINLT